MHMTLLPIFTSLLDWAEALLLECHAGDIKGLLSSSVFPVPIPYHSGIYSVYTRIALIIIIQRKEIYRSFILLDSF